VIRKSLRQLSCCTNYCAAPNQHFLTLMKRGGLANICLRKGGLPEPRLPALMFPRAAVRYWRGSTASLCIRGAEDKNPTINGNAFGAVTAEYPDTITTNVGSLTPHGLRANGAPAGW